MAGLTDRQAKFVDEYLIDLNGTQAAIRAGYSAKTANEQAARLLANVSVSEAVREAMSGRSERTKINAEYVLKQAVKLHERCMQEIEPFTDRKGEQIRDKDGNPLFVFNATGAAKALVLVGKHVDVQAFKDKVDHTSSDGTMSPPSLSDFLGGLAKANGG